MAALVLALLFCGGVGWRMSAASRHGTAGSRIHAHESTAVPALPTAEQRLLEAVARRPMDPLAHLELARACAARREPAEAAWEYAEAASLEPKLVPAQVGLAESLPPLRLTGLALARLEEQEKLRPDAVELRLALAELYLRTGQPERAATLLEGGAKGGAGSPEALLTLGRAELALGRPGAARSAFATAVRRSPTRADGYFWLGRAAWMAHRVQEARRAWEQGARLASDDPRFPCWLGVSHSTDPSPASADRAGRAFDEALRRQPDYVPALLQLGLLFQRHGRPRDAAREFLLAVDHSPSDPEPHQHLSVALLALGERAEAYRHQGLSYSLSERPTLALAAYERYRALAPHAIDGPLLISQSYAQMQQNERAAAVVERALREHPGEAALYERLGSLYVLTHSRNEAARVAEAWQRAEPRAGRPQWLLGRVEMANHRVGEAIRHFEAALAREPENADCAFALGDALVRQPDAASQGRGLALLEQAARRSPEDPEYHQRLGAALAQAGWWEEARRELLAALSLDPDRAAALNSLVQVAQGLRRPAQVALWAAAMRAAQTRLAEEKRLRREAGRNPFEPVGCLALARNLLRAGQPANAQAQIEQALRSAPWDPEARQLLARVEALQAAL
jgi:tetratricopeptide (TPR) repeat protein